VYKRQVLEAQKRGLPAAIEMLYKVETATIEPQTVDKEVSDERS
jgi:hypothetical protein